MRQSGDHTAVPTSRGIAEVEANEHARVCVLVRCLREAGVRAHGWFRIVAPASGRECRTAILETDLVSAEQPLQHLGADATFDRMARRIVLIRWRRNQRCPVLVTSCSESR